MHNLSLSRNFRKVAVIGDLSVLTGTFVEAYGGHSTTVEWNSATH